MKLSVALFVSLAASLCLAAPQGYDYSAPAGAAALAPAAAPALAPTLAPTPAPAPAYNFGYNVEAVDALGQAVQFGHQEGRQGASTTGRYFVLLPDTRIMTVDYVADATGFHPRYTFQGTAVYPASAPAPAPAPAPQGGQAVLATPGQLYVAPGGK